MKFTDGFWLLRPNVVGAFAQQSYDVTAEGDELQVFAPTKFVSRRGDVLNHSALTVTLSSPLENVVKVRIEHFQGGADELGFELVGAKDGVASVAVDDEGGSLTSGSLSAKVTKGVDWNLSFDADGRTLTSSGHKSLGLMKLDGETYLHEQLSLGVGELIYGLGERFGPLTRNGQSVDIWNADGGTASEQAYKNVPFYLTNRGYGVLVNHPGLVSFEVGSELVERVQFSVAGESLEYLVIYGPTQKQILERYTELTGRPALVPAWSFGLWLSTSFTTSYDEETVHSFIDGMEQRDLPLSVFHFDCFWMREFNLVDLEWDPRTFRDPKGMLARLHDRGLKVCVWINPYIAQRGAMFAEGKANGYLLKKPNGDVWQWDMWQPGMALVDFTNPDAVEWFKGKLRNLLDTGVDSFKTDFGERVPLDVQYFNGANPERMHNYYAELYNRVVFDLLEEVRGVGDAVVFARSATVGGQAMPVHWGGDSTSTFESMAETLRGGLSLAFGGFGFWSHDIGGFEGTPDSGVFKRWLAFGLLSSHSRLHGSSSYRVPWNFDDEAVSVARTFIKLKLSLMPYLYAAALEAHSVGTPMIRPMAMEFGDDRNAAHLDTQYMLGENLLVAPVFTKTGDVEFYLPAGMWTNYFTGEKVTGPTWRQENHGFESIPLYVRDGAVLPIGARSDRPDYDYLDGLTIEVYPSTDLTAKTITVTGPDGRDGVEFVVDRTADSVTVTSNSAGSWSARLAGGVASEHDAKGVVRLKLP
ncbi:MAG: alpha-xylosidase [Glaciihabitans sp.]|nr:alpha-xylosidase [Glaciihabitans sp.]